MNLRLVTTYQSRRHGITCHLPTTMRARTSFTRRCSPSSSRSCVITSAASCSSCPIPTLCIAFVMRAFGFGSPSAPTIHMPAVTSHQGCAGAPCRPHMGQGARPHAFTRRHDGGGSHSALRCWVLGSQCCVRNTAHWRGCERGDEETKVAVIDFLGEEMYLGPGFLFFSTNEKGKEKKKNCLSFLS